MFCAPLWPQMQPTSTIRKGILSQQANGVFARWTPRFFVLTTNFLQCYKLNNNKLTKMGKFLYQVLKCSMHFVLQGIVEERNKEKEILKLKPKLFSLA